MDCVRGRGVATAATVCCGALDDGGTAAAALASGVEELRRLILTKEAFEGREGFTLPIYPITSLVALSLDPFASSSNRLRTIKPDGVACGTECDNEIGLESEKGGGGLKTRVPGGEAADWKGGNNEALGVDVGDEAMTW